MLMIYTWNNSNLDAKTVVVCDSPVIKRFR